VLSACDTGFGFGLEEGVSGLPLSFITAGVPSVVVSQWSVPDAPTAALMVEFYRHWQDRRLDKAQALRQAMLTIKQLYPDPKDWAGFMLTGDFE
jgi:CHAT domain-containing protein